MIKDFVREMKKERESTPAEKEIFKTANQIYDTLKDGKVRKVTRRTIIKLVKSINPELSPVDSVLAGTCVESLIIAFLCEFLSSGTLVHVKRKE